jgi:hypothetical protein
MNVPLDVLRPREITAQNSDVLVPARTAELVVRLHARHRETCAAIQQSLSALGRGRLLERIRLAMSDAMPYADRRAAAAVAGVLACVDRCIRR